MTYRRLVGVPSFGGIGREAHRMCKVRAVDTRAGELAPEQRASPLNGTSQHREDCVGAIARSGRD